MIEGVCHKCWEWCDGTVIVLESNAVVFWCEYCQGTLNHPLGITMPLSIEDELEGMELVTVSIQHPVLEDCKCP